MVRTVQKSIRITSKKHEKLVSKKWCKKHWKIIKKVIQQWCKNNETNIKKSIRKKWTVKTAVRRIQRLHGQKPRPKKYKTRRTFWRPFRDLFRRSTFWCILGVRWLTFGSLWVPFGALLVSLGSLLVPFSFTFAHPGINFLTFAVSCRHFSYLLEFSMKISCKIWFLHNFFDLFQAASASRLVGLTDACQPKKAEGEGKF